MGRGRPSNRALSFDRDAAAERGEPWRRFLADPIHYLGSDPAEFSASVIAALNETAPAAARRSRVAVFTHGLPINIVLSHALGLERITHFLPGYGSVTRLRRREDGGIGVVSVNESGHHRGEPTMGIRHG